MNRFERRMVNETNSSTVNTSTKVDNVVDVINSSEDKSEKAERIREINGKLKSKILTSRNESARLLMGHEIRLNNMELNMGNLNDMKCEIIFDEQVELEKYEILNLNSGKIKDLDKRVTGMFDNMIFFKDIDYKISSNEKSVFQNRTNLKHITDACVMKTDLDEKLYDISLIEDRVKEIEKSFKSMEFSDRSGILSESFSLVEERLNAVEVYFEKEITQLKKINKNLQKDLKDLKKKH